MARCEISESEVVLGVQDRVSIPSLIQDARLCQDLILTYYLLARNKIDVHSQQSCYDMRKSLDGCMTWLTKYPIDLVHTLL